MSNCTVRPFVTSPLLLHDEWKTTLLESFDHEMLRLPIKVMQKCGQAAKTYAAVGAITAKETFTRVEKIARRASVPIATVRKQLKTLESEGFLKNKGRQRTQCGRPRRTATWSITQVDGPYGLLPTWAASFLWCEQAVLSIIMAQVARLRSVAEADGRHDLQSWIENFGGTHFQFSLKKLQGLTGLSRASVVRGKRGLSEYQIIEEVKSCRLGGGDDRSELLPSLDLMITKETIADGQSIFWFDFEHDPIDDPF